MHRRRAFVNLLRTMAFLVLSTGAAVLVGSCFGPLGAGIALVVMAVVSGYAVLRGGFVALRAMHAHPVGEAEQPALCALVRETTRRVRVPMPRVYVSPTRAANALAVGCGPNHAAICVTQGALERLDDDELRAVIGHELVHIRERDTCPASVVGAFTHLAMTIPVLGVVLAALARLGVRQSREFAADLESAQLVGEPLALASALRTLEAATGELMLPAEPGVVAASHLMIVSPGRADGVWRWLRSHPSTAERVARLERLAGYRR